MSKGQPAASHAAGTGAGPGGRSARRGTPPRPRRPAPSEDVGNGVAAPAIDATRLRVAIARVSRRLRRHELAGLTPTQLSALATVEKAGPLRLGDLAAAEGIAPSTLTRLVTVLEDRGYVQRCAVPGDARASTLAVTPEGHAVLERVREEMTRVLTGMLAGLTREQQLAIAAALPAFEQLAGPDPRVHPNR